MYERQQNHRLQSPAKLNLGLHIVGRRSEDGYHLIESLFWPIDLCDELFLQPGRAHSIHVDWVPDAMRKTELPSDPQNLVTRAIEKISPPQPTSIQLKKRIPIGAGLGGGSSNAGTLFRHFRFTDPSIASLGADIPFFLNPRPAWITGIGEQCQRLEVSPELLKRLSFLLVLPPLSISTPEAFQHYRETSVDFSAAVQHGFTDSPVTFEQLQAYLSEARNDLEPSLRQQFPILGEILEDLRKTPCLYAGISGTGACCFAIYDTENTPSKDLTRFCRTKHCRSKVVRTYTSPEV